MLRKVNRWLWRKGRWVYFLAFQRKRYKHLTLETLHGHPFLILPEVFNPAIFISGVFLIDCLPELAGKSVLDMGTGSGIGAVFAALKGAHSVVAADINPHAVRCVQINALLNHVEDRITAVESDVFSTLQGQTFDIILFNPPFYQGEPRDWLDHAWRGERVIERFTAGLPHMLESRGCAFVVLSTDGETASFLKHFKDAGFNVSIHATRDAGNEVLTVYRLDME